MRTPISQFGSDTAIAVEMLTEVTVSFNQGGLYRILLSRNQQKVMSNSDATDDWGETCLGLRLEDRSRLLDTHSNVDNIQNN